jgi:hypothetical protein
MNSNRAQQGMLISVKGTAFWIVSAEPEAKTTASMFGESRRLVTLE